MVGKMDKWRVAPKRNSIVELFLISNFTPVIQEKFFIKISPAAKAN
jgi:hypothetical protein